MLINWCVRQRTMPLTRRRLLKTFSKALQPLRQVLLRQLLPGPIMMRLNPILTIRQRPNLLKEAGVSNAKLTFYVTQGGSGMLDPVAMGTAIQADLAAVGFNVEIKTFEWNAFLGEVNPGLEGKADMAEMAWMTNDPDTLPYLALRTEAWPDARLQFWLLFQPRWMSYWKPRVRQPIRLNGHVFIRKCRPSFRKMRPGFCRQLETECCNQQQGAELLPSTVLPSPPERR